MTAIHHRIPGGPEPVAPYSHAVEADGWLFVTGQIASGEAGAPLPAGIEAETRKVFDNLQFILRGLDLGLEHVVFARVYLTEFKEDYAAMNKLYRSYFAEDRLPGRTCVGVTALADGARVEIDFIARRP